MRSATAVTVALALCGAASAHAQAPHMVKDLNQTPVLSPGSEPRHLRAADDVVYYVGQAGVMSRSLWTTGGTPATTHVVFDALQGIEPQIVPIGNVGLFLYQDAATGVEPWRTDGTPAGTGLVRDIALGPTGSGGGQLTAAGGFVFLTADDGGGIALWRSDGTEAGTVELLAGPTGALHGTDGLLYFLRSEPGTGEELWRSDGTVAGTFLLADACPGPCSSSPQHLTTVGSALYFTATDPVHGRELWRTDGTSANTALVADLGPADVSTPFYELAAAGSSLVFSTGPPGTLWRSDGTSATTVVIATIHARDLTSAAGAVFFVGTTPTAGRELWRTDGTAAGTAIVDDSCPGTCGSFDSGAAFYGSPTLLFFARFDGVETRLWRSDGTASGTFLVAQSVSTGTDYTVLGDALFFVGNSAISGKELWKTDGSIAGTVQITENGFSTSVSERPTPAGGRLFFGARATGGVGTDDVFVTEGTEETTRSLGVGPGSLLGPAAAFGERLLGHIFVPSSPQSGLWTSDGSPAGTTFLRPLTDTVRPVTLGSFALLLASEGGIDFDLWRSDGTPAGTSRVKDLAPQGLTNEARLLTQLGDVQLLSVLSTVPGLWRSDGTEQGTTVIAPVAALEGAAVNGVALLIVQDPGGGSSLWRSDGWPAGTAVLSTAPFLPDSLTATSDRVFFMASDGRFGRELWASDGTAAGTNVVTDICPGAGSAFPHFPPTPSVALNGSVYFVANDCVHGPQLWRSDGTTAGTAMLTGTAPGPDITVYGDPTAAQGRVWFQAHTMDSGRELWSSDGTPEGTALFADVAPGPYSSAPEWITSDGQRLYFTADDAVHGRELWALDLAPSLSVGDVTVAEGDATPGAAAFGVRLSAATAVTVTVAFATEDGSAQAGSDYVASSGIVTFPPGPARTVVVEVPLVGDLQEEPDETFVLRLSSPSLAVLADAEAAAFLRDDDVPLLSTLGAAATEGDAGTTNAVFGVALVTKDGAPTTLPKTLGYATEPGSAVSGIDYLPASGTITFPAGSASGTSLPVPVAVVGDTVDETNETFVLRVVATSAVQPTSAAPVGLIVDDDGTATAWPVELSHGSTVRADLAPPTGPGPDRDIYVLLQRPEASYELVVDEASGDAAPLTVQRIAADSSTVLQSAVPVGTGTARSLRWINSAFDTISDERVRIESASCGTDCGTDDTYRVRFYETTLRGARVNTTNGQTTVLLLQNLTDAPVVGFIHFRTEDGVNGGGQGYTIPARGTLVHDMSQNLFQPGSLWVTHDAPYGGVAGKAVGLDPATGFNFDTPLTSRPR
jgi:ELWxxDGT repeat protein